MLIHGSEYPHGAKSVDGVDELCIDQAELQRPARELQQWQVLDALGGTAF